MALITGLGGGNMIAGFTQCKIVIVTTLTLARRPDKNTVGVTGFTLHLGMGTA